LIPYNEGVSKTDEGGYGKKAKQNTFDYV